MGTTVLRMPFQPSNLMFYDITHQCIIPHVAIHVFLDDPHRTVSITFCFDVFLAGSYFAPRVFFLAYSLSQRVKW